MFSIYWLVLQGISELRLDAYRHGGINMTGFQLVDFHNTTVKRFFEMWSSMDNTWEGGTEPKISVSARSVSSTSCVFTLSSYIGLRLSIYTRRVHAIYTICRHRAWSFRAVAPQSVFPDSFFWIWHWSLTWKCQELISRNDTEMKLINFQPYKNSQSLFAVLMCFLFTLFSHRSCLPIITIDLLLLLRLLSNYYYNYNRYRDTVFGATTKERYLY